MKKRRSNNSTFGSRNQTIKKRKDQFDNFDFKKDTHIVITAECLKLYELM